MSLLNVISRFIIVHLIYLIYKLRYGLSDRKHLIVLIDNDSVCKNVLKYIDEYIDFYAIDRIVLYTNNKFVLNNYSNYTKNPNISINKIKNNNQVYFFINCIRFNMKYVLVPSISYPEEKGLKNLIGVNNLTEEDLIFYCELRLFSK